MPRRFAFALLALLPLATGSAVDPAGVAADGAADRAIAPGAAAPGAAGPEAAPPPHYALSVRVLPDERRIEVSGTIRIPIRITWSCAGPPNTAPWPTPREPDALTLSAEHWTLGTGR